MPSPEQQAFEKVFAHLYHSKEGFAGEDSRFYLDFALNTLQNPESRTFRYIDPVMGNTIYCKYAVITAPESGLLGLVDFQMEVTGTSLISNSCYISWLQEFRAGEKGWIGEWIYEKRNNAIAVYTILPKNPVATEWRQQFLHTLFTKESAPEPAEIHHRQQPQIPLYGHHLLTMLKSAHVDGFKTRKITDYATWRFKAEPLFWQAKSKARSTPTADSIYTFRRG